MLYEEKSGNTDYYLGMPKVQSFNKLAEDNRKEIGKQF
jgi:hypothetical protein